MLVLRMVIEGAVSMRAAARISGLVCEFNGGHRFDGLSHATVQNYLLRVGLDQISNVTDDGSAHVWIMDHMIAAGSLKCFVVLGIGAFDVAQARPESFEPKVGGLDFFDDGRMVVCTWDADGPVYLLEGATGDDPEAIKVTRIAQGLAEPLGIKVVDGTIYVLQKHELTRLIDKDGDPGHARDF